MKVHRDSLLNMVHTLGGSSKVYIDFVPIGNLDYLSIKN